MSKYKNKWIIFIKTCLWIFIFGIIFFKVSYILRPIEDTQERFCGYYAEARDSIDAVMIGSSPVHPYWSAPLAFHEEGIVSWPLSTNGLRPSFMLPLIKEAIKSQSPDLIILEGRMFTFQEEEFESEKNWETTRRNPLDHMRYTINRSLAVYDTVKHKYIKKWPQFEFDIMKYHSNWKSISRSMIEKWDYKIESELKGAFIKADIESVELENLKHIKGELKMPKEQENHLIRILEFTKNNGINICFAIAPYLQTANDKKMYNYMKNIVESKGYIFINFNDFYEEIGVDGKKDFYNDGHMNIYGCEKYTKFLARYLTQYFKLPDRRKSENYDSWNESYALWKIKKDEAISAAKNITEVKK